MAYEKIFYSRFGYYIKVLEKCDGADIFKLMKPAKLDRKDREPEMYSHDRRVLKGEINFALEKDNYNAIGLYKDEKLIGISFSSFDKEEQQPWLGYFYIEKKYRDGKASVVFINYLVNHLYKGYRIQMAESDVSKYGKLIKNVPLMGYSIFTNEAIARFAKICDPEPEDTT
jgi:hypothetical protein